MARGDDTGLVTKDGKPVLEEDAIITPFGPSIIVPAQDWVKERFGRQHTLIVLVQIDCPEAGFTPGPTYLDPWIVEKGIHAPPKITELMREGWRKQQERKKKKEQE